MKALFISLLSLTVLIPIKANAQDPFKTYIVVQRVSDHATFTVRYPNEKLFRAPQVGQKVEIPFKTAAKNAFQFVIQMEGKGKKILPCEIQVEQLNQYDRSYVCTAQDKEFTQVQVRVYTNLHGGDMLPVSSVVAKR